MKVAEKALIWLLWSGIAVWLSFWVATQWPGLGVGVGLLALLLFDVAQVVSFWCWDRLDERLA